jgi:hypothetical protein
MRPRTVYLGAFQDESTGEWGLGVKGGDDERMFAPRDGRTLAHDIMEHVNGPGLIGNPEDEIEALGAVWYIRGQFSDMSRGQRFFNQSPHDSTANDILGVAHDAAYSSDWTGKKRRPRPCKADDDFRDILQTVREKLPQELDLGDPLDGNAFCRAFPSLCLSLLRIGYHKAERKYPDARKANSLFWRLAETLDGPCKAAHENQHGEYRLIYGIKDGSPFARCHAVGEFE